MVLKKSHSNTVDVRVPFEAQHVVRYTSMPYCKKVTQLYRLHLLYVINISHTVGDVQLNSLLIKTTKTQIK